MFHPLTFFFSLLPSGLLFDASAEYQWIAADLEKVLSAAPQSVSLSVDVYLTDTGVNPDSGVLQSLPALEKDAEYDLEKGGAISPLSPPSDSGCGKRCSSSSTSISDSSPKGALSRPDAAYFSSGTSTPTTCPALDAFNGPSNRNSADLELELKLQENRTQAQTARTSVRRRFGRPDLYRILEEEVTGSLGAVTVDGEYY